MPMSHTRTSATATAMSRTAQNSAKERSTVTRSRWWTRSHTPCRNHPAATMYRATSGSTASATRPSAPKATMPAAWTRKRRSRSRPRTAPTTTTTATAAPISTVDGTTSSARTTNHAV
ncbi:hypothetical protein EBESD8_46180 [Rhodococcus aetherivorans]|nr:hypothetical protein EBESD8_46180 [Rhodococcus aetherivorans]